jgi:DNA-binding transcriptional regulator YiaG
MVAKTFVLTWNKNVPSSMNMNANDFRNALVGLGLTQAELSRLIDVTPRAISLWLAGDREVAGPVEAYLNLLLSSPRELREMEFARIREGDPSMSEGMYAVGLQGRAGAGLAVLVLEKGRVFGSDGGARYDGTYKPSPRVGFTDLDIRLTVPPNVVLVQGVPPQPFSYGFDVHCSIMARGATQIEVQTPYGPVRANVSFLREIPA